MTFVREVMVLWHFFFSPGPPPERGPLTGGGPHARSSGLRSSRRHGAPLSVGWLGFGWLLVRPGFGWLLLRLWAGFRLDFRLDFGLWLSRTRIWVGFGLTSWNLLGPPRDLLGPPRDLLETS